MAGSLNLSFKSFPFLLALFIFSFPHLLQAQMEVFALKRTDSVLKKEFQNLSPSVGAVPVNLKVLANSYDLVDTQNAYSKLIRLLFYRPDEATFHASYLVGHPAKFISPGEIGKILLAMKTRTISLDPSGISEKAKFASQLEEILLSSGKIQEILSMESLTDSKIKAQRAEIEKIKKKYNSQWNELRKLEKKYKKLSPEEEEKAKIELTKARSFQQTSEYLNDQIKISEKESLIESSKSSLKSYLRENLGTIVKARFRKHITELAWALAEAHTEEKGEGVNEILLSFMWDKLQNKKDLLPYYQELNTIGALENPEILQSDSPAQKEWLMAAYTFAEMEKLPSIPAPRELQINYIATREDNIPMPRHDIVNDLKDAKIQYTDCAENSLRNFFNALLYFKGKLHADLLDQIPFNQLHPFLKPYYEQYDTPLKLLTSQARQEWDFHMSRLNSPDQKGGEAEGKITYRTPEDKPICEIGPGMANLSLVLKKITGENSFQDIINKAKEALAKQGRSIQWNESNMAVNSDNGLVVGKIDVAFKDPQKTQNMEFHFTDGHFYFINKNQESELHATTEQQEITNFIVAHVNHLGAISPIAIDLTAQSPYFPSLNLRSALHILLESKNPPPSAAALVRKLILLSNFKTPDDLYTLFYLLKPYMTRALHLIPQDIILAIGKKLLLDKTNELSFVKKQNILRIMLSFTDKTATDFLIKTMTEFFKIISPSEKESILLMRVFKDSDDFKCLIE